MSDDYVRTDSGTFTSEAPKALRYDDEAPLWCLPAHGLNQAIRGIFNTRAISRE